MRRFHSSRRIYSNAEHLMNVRRAMAGLKQEEPHTEATESTETETLLVISLWQPWATWVMWGWKIIETRTHARFASLVQKRIGIHAAKRWDENASDLAAPFLSNDQLELTAKTDHASGALICTTFVTRFERRLIWSESKDALIECNTPRSGIWLREIQKFARPIPMIGRQGIWKVKFPLALSSAPSVTSV